MILGRRKKDQQINSVESNPSTSIIRFYLYLLLLSSSWLPSSLWWLSSRPPTRQWAELGLRPMGMFSACAVRTALRGFLFSIQPMWRVGLRVCPHGGWPTGLPTLLTLVVVTIVFNHHCQQCSGAFRFHGHSSLLCTDWRRAPESRLTRKKKIIW